MDPDLAIMAAGGMLLGLLQMLDASPDADAAALADQMTYQALRMFGMNKAIRATPQLRPIARTACRPRPAPGDRRLASTPGSGPP